MCMPIVIGRPGSCRRIAVVMRSSHASPTPRVGRDRAVRVLVAEIPGPDAGMAGERGRGRGRQALLGVDDLGVGVPVADARPSRARRRPRPTRKRGSPPAPPVAHAGIQLTPLMWPMKSVTISVTPASTAASAASTSRSSTAASIVVGVGWTSSQRTKTRTLSNPALAARARSRGA